MYSNLQTTMLPWVDKMHKIMSSFKSVLRNFIIGSLLGGHLLQTPRCVCSHPLWEYPERSVPFLGMAKHIIIRNF